MSVARHEIKSIRDLGLDYLREQFAAYKADRGEDLTTAEQEAMIVGALFTAAVWHSLESRTDITPAERLRVPARMLSDGNKFCTDMDLAPTLRTMRQ